MALPQDQMTKLMGITGTVASGDDALIDLARDDCLRAPDAAAALAQGRRTPRNEETSNTDTPPRRVARRRPAGPVRSKIAANDDVPSIGGLIYALEQKPSTKVFRIAAIAVDHLGRHRRRVRRLHAGAAMDAGREPRLASSQPDHFHDRGRHSRSHRHALAAGAAQLARRIAGACAPRP